MQVGDWIRSYYTGIWRVYRILSGFYEPRYSLASPKTVSATTLVFSRRFVNDKWKRSFSSACCEASLTKPLDSGDRAKLDSFIQANPHLFDAFLRSTPEAVDHVLNLSFGLPSTVSNERFASRCHEILSGTVANGATCDQIIGILEQDQMGSYRGKLPTTATLQFECKDHEIFEHEFVYRTLRVLPF